MSFVPERTMDRDTTRRLIRSLTWGQAIVTSTTATRCFWIRWLHLDPTLTRFALDRWTVDGRRAFALTALPLNTILWTLVGTRVSYKRKRIQMLNIFFSIVCWRIALPVIEFVSIRSNRTRKKRYSVSRHRFERMQFFFPTDSFTVIAFTRFRKPLQKYYSSRIKQNTARLWKKIAFAKQMLAPSS